MSIYTEGLLHAVMYRIAGYFCRGSLRFFWKFTNFFLFSCVNNPSDRGVRLWCFRRHDPLSTPVQIIVWIIVMVFFSKNEIKLIVNKVYFFMHILCTISVQSIKMCEARIGHKIVPLALFYLNNILFNMINWME